MLPASAERLYRAWLDANELTALTGAAVTITPRAGGKLSFFGGKVKGKVVALDPHARITLSLRVKAVDEEQETDSTVEISLQPASGGTRMTLVHSELPHGTGDAARALWERRFLDPMRRHFRAEDAEPDTDRASSGHAPTRAAAKPRRRTGR